MHVLVIDRAHADRYRLGSSKFHPGIRHSTWRPYMLYQQECSCRAAETPQRDSDSR